MTRRTILLAALGVLGVAAGMRAMSSVRGSRAIEATCDAVAVDPAAAVARSDGLVESLDPADPLFAVALTCRCQALVAVGAPERCGEQVRSALRDDPTWVDAQVLDTLARLLMPSGQHAAIAALFTASAPRFPLTAGQLAAWFSAGREGDVVLLRDAMAPSLSRLPPAETLRVRTSLAVALGRAGKPADALAVLEPPPPDADPARDDWYRTRADLVAEGGDRAELRRTMERWVAAGQDPRVAALYFAVTAILAHLTEPGSSPLGGLEAAIAAAPPSTPSDVLSLAYELRIMGNLNERGPAAALPVFEEAAARGVTVRATLRGEVERADVVSSAQAPPDVPVTVVIPDARAGDELLVLAPGDAADAAPVVWRVPPSGRVELEVRPGPATRWVARDADRGLLGSGTVAAAVGQGPITQTLPARVVRPAVPPDPLARKPADGRRQLFVFIGDCLDWRLVRYLQARGELPVFSAFEQAGVAGVLRSEPAFTGVAMEKLAHPEVATAMTVARYLHALGVELQGLESVGVNPLASLAWALPESPYLVDLVGGGDRRAINLLFSHGDIDAGRNAEIVGPNGRRQALTLSASRPLRDDERVAATLSAPISELASTYLQQMAAELDAAVSHVEAGDVDLILLRAEQTDLLTHSTYAELNQTTVDDGRSDLYAAYRYLDRRIGDAVRAADEDDVFVYMSDHGIENSLVHSPDAVFVAWGVGRSARLGGRPELAGMPRLIMAILGGDADPRWPSTDLLRQVFGEPAVPAAPP